MVDIDNGAVERAASATGMEQASPAQPTRHQVFEAQPTRHQVFEAQPARHQVFEAQGEAARTAEKAPGRVLRASAETLSEAGDKARAAAGMGETPEAKQALQEWAGLFGRALGRNCRVLIDLMQCRSVGQIMGRQVELAMANYNDWLRTSMIVVKNVAAR